MARIIVARLPPRKHPFEQGSKSRNSSVEACPGWQDMVIGAWPRENTVAQLGVAAEVGRDALGQRGDAFELLLDCLCQAVRLLVATLPCRRWRTGSCCRSLSLSCAIWKAQVAALCLLAREPGAQARHQLARHPARARSPRAAAP